MMSYFNNYFIQIHYWPNYFPLGLTISLWFDHISLLIKPLQCWLNWPICFWLKHFTLGLTISVLIWPFHYWLNHSTFYEEISILTGPFHFHFSFWNRVYWPFFFQTWWFNTTSTIEFTIDWTVLHFLLLYVVFQ